MELDPRISYVPELRKAAEKLVEEYASLKNEPIAVPLFSFGVVSVVGDYSKARKLVRATICQIAVAYAPDEVCMMAYMPTGASQEWSWLKWLPHSRLLRPIKKVTIRWQSHSAFLQKAVLNVRTFYFSSSSLK